jgi:DNA-binding GntR family transcriptional regulator
MQRGDEPTVAVRPGVGASKPDTSGLFAATLRDRVGAELRSRIVSGLLPTGTRLDLDELAAEFGSSRTPVREALIQLSYEGLVEILPRRGARVRGMTRDEVRDNFLAFGALSGAATERAVQNATPQLIERLRHIGDELAEAVAVADAERIVERNWALHREIHRASGSPKLLVLLKQLARAIPLGYFEVLPTQGGISVSEHSELIDAIERGDAARARAIAEEHVQAAGERLIAHMDERRMWRETDDGGQ